MRRLTAILATAMLLLAGCTGGHGGTATTGTSGAEPTTLKSTDTATTTAEPTGTEPTDAEPTDSAARSDGRATVEFYVSDERNAMGDFAHLNVTVTEVGLKATGGEDDSGWTTYDVEDRIVDLTELTGPNASHLGALDAANGTYQTVFVHVGDVNGTLNSGESVNVKLPSSKLQIHEEFTLGANRSVDYVFDISVFAAGKSGKYILKPVVSESGTDVPVERVGEKKEKKGKKEKQKAENDADDDRTAALNATFVGNVTAGGNVTVAVTQDGSAVANATVAANGNFVGETDADGTLTFAVSDADELEVEIETEDGSVELKRNVADEGGEPDGDGGP